MRSRGPWSDRATTTWSTPIARTLAIMQIGGKITAHPTDQDDKVHKNRVDSRAFRTAPLAISATGITVVTGKGCSAIAIASLSGARWCACWTVCCTASSAATRCAIPVATVWCSSPEVERFDRAERAPLVFLTRVRLSPPRSVPMTAPAWDRGGSRRQRWCCLHGVSSSAGIWRPCCRCWQCRGIACWPGTCRLWRQRDAIRYDFCRTGRCALPPCSTRAGANNHRRPQPRRHGGDGFAPATRSAWRPWCSPAPPPRAACIRGGARGLLFRRLGRWRRAAP